MSVLETAVEFLTVLAAWNVSVMLDNSYNCNYIRFERRYSKEAPTYTLVGDIFLYKVPKWNVIDMDRIHNHVGRFE